jgi:hypothetical protein
LLLYVANVGMITIFADEAALKLSQISRGY